MSDDPSDTAFHDLDSYLAMPRVESLAMSADGGRLVAVVSGLDAASTAYVSALWEIDPTGRLPAVRLTRGPKG